MPLRLAAGTGIEVRPAQSRARPNIVELVHAFTGRDTDVTEKFFVRCDMTAEFPFLVTKMSPYYDR